MNIGRLYEKHPLLFGVSWSIFILFELMERGMNTLQKNQQNLQHHPVSPHYLR